MKTIHIEASEPYNVIIGSGILDKSGEVVSKLLKSKHTVIVSDDNVYPLYGERLEKSLTENGFTFEAFVFPHGEESKSHKTLIELYNFLAEKNITRSDSLIALGGLPREGGGGDGGFERDLYSADEAGKLHGGGSFL